MISVQIDFQSRLLQSPFNIGWRPSDGPDFHLEDGGVHVEISDYFKSTILYLAIAFCYHMLAFLSLTPLPGSNHIIF